jgi:hypothetical protein
LREVPLDGPGLPADLVPIGERAVEDALELRGGNGPGTSAAGGGAATTATTAAGAGNEVAAGCEGASQAVGGGSGDWRDADPVSYDRPGLKPLGLPPLVVLLAVLAIPPLVVGAMRWLRRPRV